MKAQIVSYGKVGGLERGYERAKGGIFSGLTLTRSGIILLLASFLLGRVSLFEGFMPFGLAFFAATYGAKINRYFMAVAVILGMVSGGSVEDIYIVATGMILFSVVTLVTKNIGKKDTFKISAVAFFVVAVPQIVMTYFQGFLMYDILKAVFYSILVFSLTYIFRNSVSVIDEFKKRHMFSNEEMISMGMLFALSLAGLGNIQFGGFTLTNAMGILAVFIFGYMSGVGVGSSVGIIVGIIVYMANPATATVIGSYAFCGLMSGVFRKLGKFGVVLGFAAANAILTLYINGSIEVLISLRDILLSTLLFMLIPRKLMESYGARFGGSMEKKNDKSSYSKRIKELTVERLNKFSVAFQELSRTFSEISETKMATNKQDISSMFDRIADKVCKDCSLCMHCWDRNFYNTYQVMFKIVEKLEEKGRIDMDDIPPYFMERCERVGEFARQVNNIYELFKVDLVWKNRVGESRGLVSQQLDGISKVITNLANEIEMDVKFKGNIEDQILVEFDKAGVKVNDIIVMENKWGKNEVTVFHKGCDGSNKCTEKIEVIVSDVLGKRMIKDRSGCSHNDRYDICNLRLVEEENFRTTTGIAKLPKQEGEVSGDSYTFMNTGEGKYIMALSDGMGTGQKASNQSMAAISLLEQFMETGFDKDTAIRMINSILVLKSDDDSFATIDLSAVDLYEGKVEFVKIGAVPTFIKRKDRVEVVKSVSLPAGILSNIETELVSKSIDNGDFIIMVTDGIIDSFKNEDEGEQKLIKFIEDIKVINPQGIADIILTEAYSNCQGKPVDDMTVMVTKVWQRV